ncbi:hypothetical protein [Rhodopirellula baltica]
MITKPTVLILMFLLAGCGGETKESSVATPIDPLYELIVSDLAKGEPPVLAFVGTQVWINPDFCNGDSLFYRWGTEIEMDDELVEALQRASEQTSPFPVHGDFGPDGRVTEIASFHEDFYYQDDNTQVDAKCMIQFWRPGYTPDGRRAVVRFYYGPSPHGAVGTYVLQHTEGGWEIVASKIDYYA